MEVSGVFLLDRHCQVSLTSRSGRILELALTLLPGRSPLSLLSSSLWIRPLGSSSFSVILLVHVQSA